MLVLGRRVNEVIYIGDDIQIMVTDICPNWVKLGITAPPGVVILREEIYLKEKGGPRGVRPPVAEAATDVEADHKGLAGANAEQELYQSGDHKQIYSNGSKQGEPE